MSMVPSVNNGGGFGLMMFEPERFRVLADYAEMMKNTSFLPRELRGDSGNVLMAVELAARLDLPLMSVMEGMYVVPGSGKPSFYASFVHALIRKSGVFVRDYYEEEETGEKLPNGIMNRTCRLVGVYSDGTEVRGPLISFKMAYEAGWATRNKAIWSSYSDTMLQNRAVTFFARQICPDVLFGLDPETETRPGEEVRGRVTVRSVKTDGGKEVEVSVYREMVSRIKEAGSKEELDAIAKEIKAGGFSEKEIKGLREIWTAREKTFTTTAGKVKKEKKTAAPPTLSEEFSVFQDLKTAILNAGDEVRLGELYDSIGACGETGELTAEEVEELSAMIRAKNGAE